MIDDLPPGSDPERVLALSYAATDRRPDLASIWALDLTLGNIVRAARDMMVGQLRLTWWRDALLKLDHDSPPATPVLVALARMTNGKSVTGERLAGMIDGWEILLDPDFLDDAALDRYAVDRGAAMFKIAAMALACDDPRVGPAGEGWALADLARHTGDAALRKRAWAAAKFRLDPLFDVRWPVPLRPLGAITALARDDARSGGGAGGVQRVVRMLRHRITGR
ncbi:MAG: squalene/phytoene synthase family protein [Sphingomonas sp.]